MRTALTFLLTLICCTTSAQAPLWSAPLDSVAVFSSPQAADLNGDGVLDVVVGGGNEGIGLSAGVVALDGSNGNELWRLQTRDQVYGTALFEDITGDGRAEVFICGRNALLLCINGSTGVPVWEFWPDSLGPPAPSNWRQFYNPQWIPDANNDGMDDLLLSNGGDPAAIAYDSIRPPGKLCIVSGLDGLLIAQAQVPDAHETYFSPLLLDSSRILFGTGGETVRGKLWVTSLQDLLSNDISNAQVVLNDTLKGFIPVPSLADLDGDGVDDIIVPRLNAGLHALRGTDFSPLWSLDFPGYENYVSPTIGQFTGGSEPDVFGIVAKGQWAFYSEYLLFLVDGGTGQIVWTDTGTVYQMSQANAVDWDGDGWDEVLMIENRDVGWTTVMYRNQFKVIDFQTGLSTPYAAPRIGVNFFASTLIADLDADQELELVYSYSPVEDAWNGLLGARIERLGLGFFRSEIAWPGFMGRDRDARYHPPVGTAVLANVEEPDLHFHPNPARDRIWLPKGMRGDWNLWSVEGKSMGREQDSPFFNLENVNAGLYLVEVVVEGKRMSGRVVVEK